MDKWAALINKCLLDAVKYGHHIEDFKNYQLMGKM